MENGFIGYSLVAAGVVWAAFAAADWLQKNGGNFALPALPARRDGSRAAIIVAYGEAATSGNVALMDSLHAAAKASVESEQKEPASA